MPNLSLEQLKPYENKWVALLEPDEQIVGSGNDAVEASEEAERKGYKNIILLKVFPFDAFYAPSLHEVRLPQNS